MAFLSHVVLILRQQKSIQKACYTVMVINGEVIRYIDVCSNIMREREIVKKRKQKKKK